MTSDALIDIGVNLTNRAFGSDVDAVIDRAREAGVAAMIVTGTSVRTSLHAYELARARSGRGLFSTAGVHPHDAKTCDGSTLAALRPLLARPEVVAVGECGLDFNRDFSPRPDQERWFEAQLELAADLSMPLFLHERDAHGRFCDILARHRDRIGRAVIHCFTGTRDELSRYLDLDLHIGITGWVCDERRGVELRDIVPLIPDDRLMLETDAPFLLPRSIHPRPKSRRNEPAFLPWVLDEVAACRDTDRADLAKATTEVACRFFGLTCAEGGGVATAG